MKRVLRGQEWAETLIEALGEDTTELFAWMERQGRVIKRDQHSCVALLQLGGRNCYLKCYQPKGLLQRLLYTLGRGRGTASYDNGHRLRQMGLVVAQPLACVLADGAMLLLTEGIADSRDLKSLWVEGMQEERVSELMTLSGKTLADWHGAGFAHGDCKWSNFLVAVDGIYLVDLEAVTPGLATDSSCVRDLARFTLNAEDMGLSPDDYELFLGTYLAETGQDRDSLLSAVGKALMPLRRKHLAKYGPRGHSLV